jgi:hypothetical protein
MGTDTAAVRSAATAAVCSAVAAANANDATNGATAAAGPSGRRINPTIYFGLKVVSKTNAFCFNDEMSVLALTKGLGRDEGEGGAMMVKRRIETTLGCE